MHYFFKPHEANFREWRRGGYPGIPEIGVTFFKHLRSPHIRIGLEWVSGVAKLAERRAVAHPPWRDSESGHARQQSAMRRLTGGESPRKPRRISANHRESVYGECEG
jgi:hypothetical protein